MNKTLERMAVLKGDITEVSADAVVNAANSLLTNGSGVNGAIHRKGGPVILEECSKIIKRQGSCPTGQAVITQAGNLPAKWVIHTVGPIWQGCSGGEPGQLASCYQNVLKLAIKSGCKTVAFPNISTGVYGFPKKEAAEIAVRTVYDFLSNAGEIDEVLFVCFDILECGICKIFARHGFSKYAFLLCEVDYITSALAGLQLVRMGTIANGAEKCDFRFIRIDS